MCLAVPVRVVELRDNDAAMVDLGGIRKEISLALVDDVAVGDYVILHVGYALARLDPAEAERTLALFAQAGLAGADDPSPFKGEDGRGMGVGGVVDAGTEHPSPFKGEDGRGMGFQAGTGTPSPPLPPPLEGEGNDSGALPGQRA